MVQSESFSITDGPKHHKYFTRSASKPYTLVAMEFRESDKAKQSKTKQCYNKSLLTWALSRNMRFRWLLQLRTIVTLEYQYKMLTVLSSWDYSAQFLLTICVLPNWFIIWNLWALELELIPLINSTFNPEKGRCNIYRLIESHTIVM